VSHGVRVVGWPKISDPLFVANLNVELQQPPYKKSGRVLGIREGEMLEVYKARECGDDKKIRRPRLPEF
jgi:hypothetical protein